MAGPLPFELHVQLQMIESPALKRTRRPSRRRTRPPFPPTRTHLSRDFAAAPPAPTACQRPASVAETQSSARQTNRQGESDARMSRHGRSDLPLGGAKRGLFHATGVENLRSILQEEPQCDPGVGTGRQEMRAALLDADAAASGPKRAPCIESQTSVFESTANTLKQPTV